MSKIHAQNNMTYQLPLETASNDDYTTQVAPPYQVLQSSQPSHGFGEERIQPQPISRFGSSYSNLESKELELMRDPLDSISRWHHLPIDEYPMSLENHHLPICDERNRWADVEEAIGHQNFYNQTINKVRVHEFPNTDCPVLSPSTKSIDLIGPERCSSGKKIQKGPERMIQRVKANKKERRRTQSINQAFGELRRHIPDVPSDTKLSKIKTLRLAISYISHLMSVLGNTQSSPGEATKKLKDPEAGHSNDQPSTSSLVVDLNSPNRRSELQWNRPSNSRLMIQATNIGRQEITQGNKDRKHRTGWPEIVWKTSNL